MAHCLYRYKKICLGKGESEMSDELLSVQEAAKRLGGISEMDRSRLAQSGQVTTHEGRRSHDDPRKRIGEGNSRRREVSGTSLYGQINAKQRHSSDRHA